MLSNELIHALEALDVPHGIPENKLPEGVTKAMVELLVERGLVERYTLVPPGKEVDFCGPDGFYAYHTTEEGREELRLYRAERRKGARSHWWDVLLVLGGALLGCVLEHFPEIAAWVKGLF